VVRNAAAIYWMNPVKFKLAIYVQYAWHGLRAFVAIAA